MRGAGRCCWRWRRPRCCVGWRTRLAAAALLVSLGWIELIDATTYLNHYWFLTLVAALAVVAPLGRAPVARRPPGRWTRDGGRGWVWLLRFQVGVVYAFAGLAKLQPDWLVRALPARAVAARPAPTCRCSGGWSGIDGDAPRLRGRRRRVRLPDRAAAAVAADAVPGVAGAGRLPRLHLGAVPDRRVPVADDRRVHGVLRARLAPPPARSRRVGPVAVPRVAPGAPLTGARWRWRSCGWWCSSRCRCATSPTPATTDGRARATASPGTCCWSRRPAA